MKNLLYIGNKLASKGKTVTTLETLSNHLKDEGYSVITASDKSNKILRLFDMLWIIFKNRKVARYVLIDTYSTQNFYYALLSALLCNKLKLKYIPILHGGNLPNRLKKNKKLADIIFKNAYKNVAPSLYIQSIFNEYGYSNLIMIPNTIEIENYLFKKRNFSSINILWVRSFSKIYNPNLAVKVAHQLKSLGEEVKLCMIGPDKDGTLAESQNLSQNLNIDTEFTGKLSKNTWIKKSEHFNIFLNTANVDNTPVSVIEAMALGLPVVSTNVGGIPYLISHNEDGILVEKENPTSMRDAILNIKNNLNLSNKLSENARKKAETFDWKKNKELWRDLLK